MLKKVVFGIVAGGLVFAAQGASAGDQFWNGERYESVTEGVLKLPTGAQVLPAAVTPPAEPRVERATRQASATRTNFPAPYDTDMGYFN